MDYNEFRFPRFVKQALDKLPRVEIPFFTYLGRDLFSFSLLLFFTKKNEFSQDRVAYISLF